MTPLRAVREARGWSQSRAAAEFARTADILGHKALSVSERHFRRWESADPPLPRPAQARVLEALFGLPIEALGLAAGVAEADDWNLETTIARIAESAVMPEDMTRRGALALSGQALKAYLLGWIVAEPQLAARSPESWPHANEASRLRVEALATQVDRLWLVDAEVGTESLLRPAASLLHRCAVIIQEKSLSRSDSRRLLGVSADAAALAGWSAVDLRRMEIADKYFDTALRTAHGAEDDFAAAFVANLIGIRHYMHGKPDDAAVVARAARTRIDKVRGPNLSAMLLLTEARSYARAGDGAKAYYLIDLAFDTLSHTDGAEDTRLTYKVSTGEMFGQAGSAALDLGDEERAEEFFEHGAASYSHHETRSSVLHAVRRAAAAARQNVLERIPELLPSVEATKAVRSKQLRAELMQLRNDVAHRSGSESRRSAVDRLDELLAVWRVD